MGITFDLAQLVLDNEVAGLIKRTVNGIEVNDETLSLDTIKEIGPFKDYLAHETTYRHMRLTTSPKLMDRRMRPRWEAAGSKDAYQRACEEVLRILENYEPPRLSDEVLQKVRDIVRGAEAELGIVETESEISG
ncbi:trimethylamine---corrinoid protein Co-methyltransferase [Desulforhopalus singaporensis]|uniref:Trimethylamine---corrinoid protein Co-methyltransferase n=1 Tax=Desulforhopalus singaporensis TaxID=91360 RepID=A0A1H0RY22_9BACT|nr:trimethylamine---corrinoid protein Co-methyltransferase [Desulforhopalus singaporensis]